MLIILDIQTSVSTVILPKNMVKNTEESITKRVAEKQFSCSVQQQLSCDSAHFNPNILGENDAH